MVVDLKTARVRFECSKEDCGIFLSVPLSKATAIPQECPRCQSRWIADVDAHRRLASFLTILQAIADDELFDNVRIRVEAELSSGMNSPTPDSLFHSWKRFA